MAEKTTKERIEYLSNQEKGRENFAKLQDILQLINLEKTRNITTQVYSKDLLRTYLRNPATEANQKNLRKLSSFLYNMSHVYKRLVNYKAQQVNLKSWVAYPLISLSEDNDAESIKAEYERVTKIVRNMHMEAQIYKIMLSLYKYGVFYGFVYGDPEGDGSFYLHSLNPDYCRIYSASHYGGVLGCAYDTSYFTQYPDDLEYFDPIFQKLKNQADKDNIKWKELPPERTICLKLDLDNLDYSMPYFSSMMNEIIDLEDLESIQAVQNELEAYKLIWAKIDTISGSKEPDDFSVDLSLANDFYRKLLDIVPSGISVGMSPLDLNVIDFQDNKAAETVSTLSKAMQSVLETNGAIVLNSNRITNSASFLQAMRVEAIDVCKIVDEQINPWVNLYLKFNHNVELMAVDFDDTSPYFIEEKLKYLKEASQYGLPLKLCYAALNGLNPVKERGLAFIEQTLGLGTTEWTAPLVSSNTQSAMSTGDEQTGGAPKKENDGDLSDEGQATRDKK